MEEKKLKSHCNEAGKFACPYKVRCKVYSGTDKQQNGAYFLETTNLESPEEVYAAAELLKPKSRVWTIQSEEGKNLLVICNPQYLGGETFFDKEAKAETNKENKRLRHIEMNLIEVVKKEIKRLRN